MTARLRDPQSDVDDDVRRHIPTGELGDFRHELIRRWRHYAQYGEAKARADEDEFGADLHRCRASIRAKAAAMLDSREPLHEAAAGMMACANRCSVRTPPLIGYDRAALSYTAARTWQACAWDIDPTLPAMQPLWA